MEGQWDLDKLYLSFQDQQFLNDIELLKKYMTNFEVYPTLQNNEENLVKYLKEANAFHDLIEKLFSYVNLMMSANTFDHEALKYSSTLESLLASFASTDALIQKWISSFDLSKMEDTYVKEHMYILEEIQTHQKYLLDEKSEVVLANMKTAGSSSWAKYKDQLVSSMTVDIDNKTYPLTEVLNMAYSKDKEVRKKAYEAEIASYKQVEQGIASALNAIKGESLIEAKLRGYSSVLERTLIDSRMTQKTLDALLNTIQKALSIFEKYFQTKAKYLGYTHGLPWYDMYAPIIEVKSEYPYEKGCDFVVKQFSSFSKNLGDYARYAMDHHWIDVYPRSGKVGGAFCNNLHCIEESRFLLNYGNDFSDLITLSHELGHGYHGHCLNKEYALNASYPMPIAETASTFSETIVKKAALKDASDDEKIMILENELSDCAQVIVDIYSRFLFESRLIEKRKEGPLSVEEIKNLMLEAQKEAYRNGLDHEYLHPYMWTWKPHYYEADYAFYNFPYAFGLLLAKGLYAMYLKEGESFAKKYDYFLSLTGKMSLVDVGKSIGIDLEDEKFWQNSIDMIQEDLNMFYDLLEKHS